MRRRMLASVGGVRVPQESTIVFRISSEYGYTVILGINDISAETTIDWGDGSSTVKSSSGNVQHTYESEGDFVVRISNTFSTFNIVYNTGQVSTPGNVYYTSANSLISAVLYCKEISDSAFYRCNKLQSCSLFGVESLGKGAFLYCNALESLITSGDFRGNIGDQSFADTILDGVELTCPNVTAFGSYVFRNSRIRSVVSGATSLSENAFREAYYIRSLVLGEIATISSYSLRDVGLSNSKDATGYTCHVTVGNTMDSIMAFTSFPFAVPNTTKFVCSDGYVDYVTNAWTKHPQTT